LLLIGFSNGLAHAFDLIFFSLDAGGDSTVPNGLSSPSEPQDVVMEEDTARPEGFIRFTVQNFSKLDKATLSDPIYVRNLPW